MAKRTQSTGPTIERVLCVGVEAGRLAASRITRPRISRTLHLGFRPSGPPSAASQAVHHVIQDVAAERIKQGGGFWRAAEE